MTARFRGYSYGMLVLSLGVAACSTDGTTASSTTPESFDAATAQASLDAVDAVTATPVWESFGVLDQRLDASVVGSDFLENVAADVDASNPAELGAQMANAALDGPAAAPRIPDDIRGITFVFDPDERRYVADPDRADAPEIGVRFVLYAVNPVTGEPIIDEEIGYADLTDLDDDTETGFTLRFEVVSDGVTYLDYTVSLDGTETTGSLALSGFVSNGNDQIDVEVDVAGTNDGNTATQDVTFRIAAADRLTASATVRGSNSVAGGMGQVDLTVSVDDTEIALDVDGRPDRIDATIKVNGEAFATVSGNPASPDIRAADGRSLRPDERRALHQMLRLVGKVFQMFNHLMQPVGQIVGLSSIQL